MWDHLWVSTSRLSNHSLKCRLTLSYCYFSPLECGGWGCFGVHSPFINDMTWPRRARKLRQQCMKLSVDRLSNSSIRTRRSILASVASVYDLMGLISPLFFLFCRNMIQQTCKSGLDGNESLASLLINGNYGMSRCQEYRKYLFHCVCTLQVLCQPNLSPTHSPMPAREATELVVKYVGSQKQ